MPQLTEREAPAEQDQRRDGESAAARGGVGRRLTTTLEHSSLLLCCVGVIALFGVLRPAEFLQWSNFANIFGSQAVLVVLTLALLWPLRAGDYDLSVAGILTLCSMVAAVLDVRHGWSLGAIVVAVLVTGAAGRRGQRRS